MKKYTTFFLLALCCSMAFAQRTIFVAPDGDDSGTGTIDSPWLSIQKALDEVAPGGTIYLREGTYYPAKRLCPPRKATSPALRITVASYPGERAVIDGSMMSPTSINDFKQSRCLYLTYWNNYYHIKDIDFCHALDNGVKVEGSFNIIENCRFHHNNDSGLQIGMFKDWKIEEHNGFFDDNGVKITGSPEFNPGYQLCRGNKVINCDSWANADLKAFNGTDDGGDADGFACKLFPGPGTEFYGCRAWINSDDNWDLYMVYHPVVIDHCIAYKGGYTEAGELIGNGNGFKLGGGGSSGGAAFSQSVGAHVVRNCIAFDNGHKGFDQNNAYEGMYIINCTGWDNEYNFRFPTVFMYGGMYIRNCVGFNATKLNHEFLSEDKEGAVVPNTDFNSWTTLDGCYPYKDGKKNGGKENIWAKDYSQEFLSLSVDDFLAEREPDGSLPDNDFAKLKEGSVLIDKGTPICDFFPARFMTEAKANGLDLVTAEPFTIPFLGEAPDFGAKEFGSAPVSRLTLISGSPEQTVYVGTEIDPVSLAWTGDIIDVDVSGLTASCGLSVDKNVERRSLTISGSLNESVVVTVHPVGVEDVADIIIRFTASTVAPATLCCTSDNASQTVMADNPIEPIVYVMGGGATVLTVTESIESGLIYSIDGNTLTISGTPKESVTYTVCALGGLTDLKASGSISVVMPTHTLGAADDSGWYQFQTDLDNLPADLAGHLSLNFDNADSYGRQFNTSGDISQTFWCKDYMESGYTPLLSATGACNIGSGSALAWALPSCSALKVNMYCTGKRTFKIYYKRQDIDADWLSRDIPEMSKGAYEMDILSLAGILPCTSPIEIRLECSSKGSKMLGARIWDMYVECFGKGSAETEGIVDIYPDYCTNGESVSVILTATTLVAQGADIREISLFSADGSIVAHSSMSGLCPISHLTSGFYIARITTKNGAILAKKILIK